MSEQTKEAVLAAIRSHGSQIQATGVRRLGLFGSFVRSQQTPNSDVDILVEFDPALKTFDNFMRLSVLLEDLCQRRVDLVTTESLSPYLRPHIIKEVEYVHIAG